MQYFQWVVIALTLWLLPMACGHQPDVSPAPTPDRPHKQVVTLEYSIQVGAFSKTGNASRFAESLKRRGLDAYYFADKDGLFKVRFGNFDSKDQARQKGKKLVARGIVEDYYIVRPGGNRRYSGSTLRRNIVRTAEEYIGLPYRWGGASPESGFDCSGLTMTVYRLNGLNLPRSSTQQYQTGTPISRRHLQRGDLVFFATAGGKRVSHVGIYAGDGKFIHAPKSGRKIESESLSNSYFSRRYVGARTYLE